LKGVSCDPNDESTAEATLNCPLINQGSTNFNGQPAYGIAIPDADATTVANRLIDNCKKAEADQAFQFIAFGLALATLFLCFLFLRNGRPSGKRSYV
jgi:hypothetical protein